MPWVPLAILLPLSIAALIDAPVTSARTARAHERVEDILARSRAAYAALHSYADTGTVDVEYGPPGHLDHDRHRFYTFFRKPRLYLFDFVKNGNGDRLVVWSGAASLHRWWRATGSTDEYPKGQGTMAFLLSEAPTEHAITQLAPLLFAGAGLTGPLTEFDVVTDAGLENIDGHPCHKLEGTARSQYGKTGHAFNARQMIVWVDRDTYLVRRVFEDATDGNAGAFVRRVTTTFSPHANPALDDAQFRFVPPTAAR